MKIDFNAIEEELMTLNVILIAIRKTAHDLATNKFDLEKEDLQNIESSMYFSLNRLENAINKGEQR